MVRPTQERDQLLSETFERDYTALCRLAFLLLGDKAQSEETVMEAFTRTCRSWATIRDVERIGVFVRRAVINETRNQMRKRGNERSANQRWTSQAVGAGIESSGDDEVVAALRALPPRQRAAVVLHYLEDLSEADTAAVLGCSAGTVKSQLAKARATLGARLRQDATT